MALRENQYPLVVRRLEAYSVHYSLYNYSAQLPSILVFDLVPQAR